jgi:hypothetical protein
MTTTDTTAKTGDRVVIVYGRPGYRPAQYTGTVLRVETFRLVIQRDEDRGTAIASGLHLNAIQSIEIKATPEACTAFQGTGTRCTQCRYRRDFH